MSGSSWPLCVSPSADSLIPATSIIPTSCVGLGHCNSAPCRIKRSIRVTSEATGARLVRQRSTSREHSPMRQYGFLSRCRLHANFGVSDRRFRFKPAGGFGGNPFRSKASPRCEWVLVPALANRRCVIHPILLWPAKASTLVIIYSF